MRKSKAAPLSVKEAREIFRAGPPIRVWKGPMDPAAMRALTAMVQERLISTGGRPTDPTWTLLKKVPMREETWTYLEEATVKILEVHAIRVSPGQLAAIALERGISDAIEGSEHPARRRSVCPRPFRQDVENKAKRLRAVRRANPLWSSV